MKATAWVAGMAVLIFAIAPTASGEWYAGVYVGASFPVGSDVEATAPGAQVTAHDVDFKTSAVFGGKVGHWLKPLPWLGLEIEAYHHDPDAPAQTVSFTVGGTPAGTDQIGKVELGVTIIGLNLLVRLPGEMVQPYAGVGPALFVTRIRDTGQGGASIITPTGQKDTDVGIGVQALAGLKVFVTKQLAVFTEYKFSHHKAEVRFADEFLGGTDVSTTLNIHFLYGGLAFHF